MKIINYTTARNNLRQTIDDCCNDSVPVCVVSKSNQVVILNKTDYDNMFERCNFLQQIDLRSKHDDFNETITSSADALRDLLDKQSKDWSDK